MRIAHVSDCYLPRLGGIEVNVSELADRQRAVGHEVTVITSTRADLPAGAGTIRVDRGASPAGQIVYRRSGRVRRLVREGEFDLVHAHASTFSPLAYLAAHQAAQQRIPTVLTVHSLWADATPLFRIADRLTRWSEWPVAWTAVSEVAAAELRRVLARGEEVTVVPNGIEPQKWRVSPIRGTDRHLRIVAVGRLASRKRTVQLVRLLLNARKQLPEMIQLTVEVIGDGPDRRPLERYLRRNDMTDWVRLRGALTRDEIRAVFARSDLFVAPAVLESFGIAALEARCAGVPVLARSGTGVRDFIDHGVHGWLVDSDRQMTQTVVDLALDRHRLADAAARTRTNPPPVDWSMALGRLNDVYASAAAKQGRELLLEPRDALPATRV